MVHRKTVSFDDELYSGINKYRASFVDAQIIPSFTKAVNDLLREKLKERKFI